MRTYNVQLREKDPSGEHWVWMPIESNPVLECFDDVPAGGQIVINCIQLRYLVDRYVTGSRTLILSLAAALPIYIEDDLVGMDIVRRCTAAEHREERRRHRLKHFPHQMLPESKMLLHRHERWARAAAISFDCELDGPRAIRIEEMRRQMPLG